MLLDHSQCFVQQQGKAHLPTLNMPFFKRVQLLKIPYPCFLTPLQCFVEQPSKAHLPTLNMPFFYKVHLAETSLAWFLTLGTDLFGGKGKPTRAL